MNKKEVDKILSENKRIVSESNLIYSKYPEYFEFNDHEEFNLV